MSRSISTGTLVRAQADFINPPNSSTRIVGIVATDITLSVFVDNAVVSWPILDGTSVSDSSISYGNIYFNQITGKPGFYSVRLFPNKIGFWRIVMVNTSLSLESSFDFDVVPAQTQSSGLTATF